MSVRALAVPGAPTGVTATPGDGQAVFSFALPADGGPPVTDYTMTCDPGGIAASAPGPPITVGGLTNGASYSCSVTASNDVGTGPPSAGVVVGLAVAVVPSLPASQLVLLGALLGGAALLRLRRS